MSSNPVNLAIRFLLEIAALAAFGVWGWMYGEGWTAFVFALLVPVSAATLWGVFRVPGDPGRAPVVVPGVVRLLLELLFFAAAVWCLYNVGANIWGLILAIATGLHYAASYDRIGWLLAGARPEDAPANPFDRQR